jgi:hypothetical protein
MNGFNVGDTVRWRSQAAGSQKEKVGRVVEIVMAGSKPSNRGSSFAYGGGMNRNHDSYVVEVQQGQKKRPLYYWPRVNKLELVERAGEE